MEICAMIGCTQPMYKSLSIGPAASVELCQEHFMTIKTETSYDKSKLDESTKPLGDGSTINLLIRG